MNDETLFLDRACPGCGNTQSHSDTSIHSSILPDDLLFSDLISHWRGFFKKKVFFSYERCAQCALLYCPRYFSAEQLSTLYAQMPDNTAEVAISVIEKTQRDYFNLLKKHATLSGDYLEIGPDIGLFTAHCVQARAFNRFWLFEPNQAVWSTLSAQVSHVPHQILPEMSNFDAVPDHSISMAVLIHVLDHLLDPIDTLQKIAKKLMPNATIMIVTHDESSKLAGLIKERWPAYCLQHPQLYNPTSITALLAREGFQVKAIEKTRNYFPVMYLLKHLLWVFGITRISLPAWHALQIPLKLGNMMTIATWNGQKNGF